MKQVDHVRTLSIVQQLAAGKRLTLPTGQVIGMGEDMSIGFLIQRADGEERVAGLSTMDLAQLNRLLNEYDIGMLMPND